MAIDAMFVHDDLIGMAQEKDYVDLGTAEWCGDKPVSAISDAVSAAAASVLQAAYPEYVKADKVKVYDDTGKPLSKDEADKLAAAWAGMATQKYEVKYGVKGGVMKAFANKAFANSGYAMVVHPKMMDMLNEVMEVTKTTLETATQDTYTTAGHTPSSAPPLDIEIDVYGKVNSQSPNWGLSKEVKVQKPLFQDSEPPETWAFRIEYRRKSKNTSGEWVWDSWWGVSRKPDVYKSRARALKGMQRYMTSYLWAQRIKEGVVEFAVHDFQLGMTWDAWVYKNNAANEWKRKSRAEWREQQKNAQKNRKTPLTPEKRERRNRRARELRARKKLVAEISVLEKAVSQASGYPLTPGSGVSGPVFTDPDSWKGS